VNAFVAGFIGSPRMNFLAGIATHTGKIKMAGTEFAPTIATRLVPGQKLKVGIRPEFFDAAKGIEIGATVKVVEALGATSYLYSTTGSGETIVAERRANLPRIGDKVKLRFAPTAVRLFSENEERIR
jgi:ABC-type sugar transport system ATPase subunit